MSNDKRIFLKKIMTKLKLHYKNSLKSSLNFSSPWQLLVATILSAQAQDKQVNKATVELFKKYPDINDYLNLKPNMLFKYIKHIGLYRNKGNNIIKASHYIRDNFNSKIPKNIDELVQIPGVGRKTANVVLSGAYNLHHGIAIDTHCITVANRLGIAKTKNPEKIERILIDNVDINNRKYVSNAFIVLGRDTCTARRKYCNRCVLKNICPSSDYKNR